MHVGIWKVAFEIERKNGKKNKNKKRTNENQIENQVMRNKNETKKCERRREKITKEHGKTSHLQTQNITKSKSTPANQSINQSI